MVSRVLYRPFETEDFDTIAQILRELWHHRSDNEDYNRLEAACDLAYCLSTSTFSQVAVIDGQARGICLAHAGKGTSNIDADRWMDAERGLLAQMRELEPTVCAEYLSFVRATISTNNRLLESTPMPCGDEVTLLAVDEEMRGLGVGTVLLDAAVSHLSARGATTAHLYTDATCSYQFYEGRGFKRAATHRANREERRRDMPRETYLYELDLTA